MHGLYKRAAQQQVETISSPLYSQNSTAFQRLTSSEVVHLTVFVMYTAVRVVVI
jgi:hypothetical protein